MSDIEIIGKTLLTMIVVLNVGIFLAYLSIVFLNYITRDKYEDDDSIDI